MGLTLRWVGASEADRVGQTRLRCYAAAESERASFVERAGHDPRAVGENFLLAEENHEALGTATHLPMTMWVRGSSIAAQGVAWVGAIKTARRRASGNAGGGVATTVMNEVLRRGREEGCVVSALMPFRGSFYEHFGYGMVERRTEWTLPMAVLPSGPFDGIRYYESDDFAARAQCLRRINRSGQCDIERSDAYWQKITETAADGFQFVDRPVSGEVRGALWIQDQITERNRILKVNEIFFEDVEALRRQLHFLSAQRDQYSLVRLTLPGGVPLNWLLKEVQLPHRPVHHATAELRPFTRMQLRILDHSKFLAALKLPADASGAVAVEVREPEGQVARLGLEIGGGRISVGGASAAPAFACTAARWAAIASGDMAASTALRFGLAEGDAKGAAVLDVLARGPAPFCHEYF